jgi:tetratricopeptide (TPR) repeat protein
MAIEAEAAGAAPPPTKAEFLRKQFEPDRNQASALLAEGKFTEAVPLFRTAEAAYQDDTIFLGDYGRALTAVGGRANLYEAVTVLESAVRLDAEQAADNPSARNQWLPVALAEAYSRGGRYEDAATQYREALTLNPQNGEAAFITTPEEQREEAARAMHDHAAEMLHEGDNRGALKEYEKVLVLVGEDNAPWSVQHRGVALLHLGQVEDAIPELEKGTQMIPDSVWPHVDLAAGYAQIGDRDRARQEYHTALSIDPENAVAKEKLQELEQSGEKGGSATLLGQPTHPGEEGDDAPGPVEKLKEKAGEVFTAVKDKLPGGD